MRPKAPPVAAAPRNHANATEALEAANERNEVQVNLASEKRCKI
jgi:hypothetical protein